jgi:hypothetical protein
MGGFRDAFAGLLGAFFGERLDTAGTEHGAVLVDDAEGELRAAEVKGQYFTHEGRKRVSRGPGARNRPAGGRCR